MTISSQNSRPARRRSTGKAAAKKASTGKTAAGKAKAPSRKRGEARVAALLAAAAAVFAEKGVEAATMTEIAARAGAPIGSLYQFFPSKAALADDLHAREFESLSARIDDLAPKAGKGDGAALADKLFQTMLDFLVAHPAFIALAERRDIDRKRKKANAAKMRRQMAALFAATAAPFPPARAEALAAVLLQLMKAAVTLSGEEDATLRRNSLRELRRMLRRSLAAEKT